MSKVFLNKLEFRDYQLSVVNQALTNNKITLSNSAILSYNTLKTFVSGLLYLIPDGGFIALVATTIWSIIDDVNAAGNNASNNETIPSWAKSFFDTQCTSYQLDVLKIKLKDVKDFKTNFQNYLTTLKSKPTDPTAQSSVRNSFEDLDRYLITCYNSALTGDDANKGKLLPMYVLYVTLRLVHLRDGYLNGLTYGYTDALKATFLTNYELLYTEALTTVNNTFNNAVAKIKSLNSNQGVLQWNAVNKYRSSMIVNAFDYVNIWYTLHPVNFPLKTASESVRYVYSDIAGFPVNGGTGFISGSNSQIDTQYYNTCYQDIETNVMNKGEFKRDLQQIALRDQNGRLKTVSTIHIDKSLTAGSQQVIRSYGGDQNNLTPWIAISSVTTGVSYTYDVYPKSVSFDNRTINFSPSSSVPAENHYTSGWYDIYILPNNFGKTSCDYVSNDWQAGGSDSRCARSIVSGSTNFAGHKIGNVFALNQLKDQLLKDTGMLPLADSICFGFLPVEIFQDNIILAKMYNIVDPLKYISISSSYWFKPDYVRPGANGLEIPIGTSVVYSFDPESDTQFVLGIKFSTDYTSNIKIYNADNQLKFDLKLTKSYSNIIWGSNANTCVLNRGVGKNRFRFENPLSGSNTVFLEAILLKPYIQPKSA